MCSSDNQRSKPVFLQSPANLPPNTANQDLDFKNKLPWPMEDNRKTFAYDTGIRCWGVCLTSVVLKMVSMGVGNCFGAILLVRGHSSLFGSQGAWVPPIFGTLKTSAFSTSAQSKFVSVVPDGVVGHLRLVFHTWWCP